MYLVCMGVLYLYQPWLRPFFPSPCARLYITETHENKSLRAIQPSHEQPKP